MPEVPEAFRQILAGILDIPPEQVTPELGFGQVEAWDSFGHLQIVLALEEHYCFRFDPQRIPTLTTVALLRADLQAGGKPA